MIRKEDLFLNFLKKSSFVSEFSEEIFGEYLKKIEKFLKESLLEILINPSEGFLGICLFLGEITERISGRSPSHEFFFCACGGAKLIAFFTYTGLSTIFKLENLLFN